MEKDFGSSLAWFIGVVEDRHDPEKLGRVRVRCLGHHTENKSEIATQDLSWSVVMSPTSSPSMDGMGCTPPFLVEGSWVTGFFLDRFKQEAVVVGSLPGFNTKKDPGSLGSLGFRDPSGKYPRSSDHDTNLLGRDGAWARKSKSWSSRTEKRITKGIQKAQKPVLSSVEDSRKEVRPTWTEPEVKGGTSPRYPYNHVTESESGHIVEIDDTPGGETILHYHRSGTFNEIHPDGSKVTKILGDDFELTLQDKNVYVKGDCSVTIDGDARCLVKGDYVFEVLGDYFEKIHGNKTIKIGASGQGSETFEILGKRSGNINDSDNLRIGKNGKIYCDGDYSMVVNGTESHQINSSLLFNVEKAASITARNRLLINSHAHEVYIVSAKDMSIHSGEAMYLTAINNIEETGAEIHLNKS